MPTSNFLSWGQKEHESLRSDFCYRLSQKVVYKGFAMKKKLRLQMFYFTSKLLFGPCIFASIVEGFFSTDVGTMLNHTELRLDTLPEYKFRQRKYIKFACSFRKK